MLDYQKIGTEYLELLRNDPLSIPAWLFLQYKFMLPAMLIARNDETEKWMEHFSLNGIRSNICKPY